MCASTTTETITLSGLRRLVTDYAAAFDVDVVDARDVKAALKDAVAIENSAAAMKALLAARLADTNDWAKDGCNSPDDQLARLTGTSVTRSREAIKTGQRLGKLEATCQAALGGELSADQSSAISDAGTADPSAESKLLEKSKRSTLRELNEECGKTKAATEDPEARQRRIHNARSLRNHTDRDGTFHIHGNNTTTAGAIVMGAIGVERDRLFEQARRDGRRESMDAYAADALTSICAQFMVNQSFAAPAATTGTTAGRTSTATTGSARATGPTHASSNGGEANLFPVQPEPEAPSPVPRTPNRGGWRDAKIIFLVSLDAYRRGYPLPGETVEIAGIGPVPVSVVEEAANRDAFTALALFNGVGVASVAHLGRNPTAHQLTALQAMKIRCAGCGTRHNLQIHHVDPWKPSRVTRLDKLRFVCGHNCHPLITHKGWDFDDHDQLVPPDHPRHPRHKPPPARAG